MYFFCSMCSDSDSASGSVLSLYTSSELVKHVISQNGCVASVILHIEWSSCSDCSVAECFPDMSSWCWSGQVCQGVKCVSNGPMVWILLISATYKLFFGFIDVIIE